MKVAMLAHKKVTLACNSVSVVLMILKSESSDLQKNIYSFSSHPFLILGNKLKEAAQQQQFNRSVLKQYKVCKTKDRSILYFYK